MRIILGLFLRRYGVPMRLTSLILLLSLILVSASPAFGQDAAPQIKAEIARLQKSLKDNPVTDPIFSGMASETGKILDAANQSVAAGQLYLSLEKLELAENLVVGMHTAADKDDVVKNGLPAFEARWSKASFSLTALDQRMRDKDWGHSLAVMQALYQEAQGSAIPLLDGARGFATSTNPPDGLFNLGQAMGEAEFVSFAASLHLPQTKAALPLRSILPELNLLQEKTNAAFQPPKSIELQSGFIALNSALKVAEELDAKKSYAGALYQYLLAVGYYGMLNAKPLDAASQAELKVTLAAVKKKLDESSTDETVAQLFQQRAEAAILPGGSMPSADDWRAAKVILEEVLPAYFALRSPAVPANALPTGKTVALTLVRWPYT